MGTETITETETIMEMEMETEPKTGNRKQNRNPEPERKTENGNGNGTSGWARICVYEQEQFALGVCVFFVLFRPPPFARPTYRSPDLPTGLKLFVETMCTHVLLVVLVSLRLFFFGGLGESSPTRCSSELNKGYV